MSPNLVALLYLVTEELLVEAHAVPEQPWTTAMFFIGFLGMLVIEEIAAGDGEADADRAVQDMLAQYPDDAWALRQRALVLAERRQTEEALREVRRAGELEPDHVWYYSVLAQVQRRADRTAEAAAAIRSGLRLNIDQEPLVAELVQLSRGRREKREALEFVEGELRRQPHTGEGLVAYVGAEIGRASCRERV